MNTTPENQQKKHICAALLAHVDAGKTTLSEALLYESGVIRTRGRVDHKDAFLDTSPLERERGITIFSKQACFSYGNMDVTMLDTPGHVDFSSEMERTLQVIDYAVLIISGTDGVQVHTETVWKLLQKYRIPTFFFVNKMDLPGADKAAVLKELQAKLSPYCVDFTEEEELLCENVAMCEETLLETYLEEGTFDLKKEVRRLVSGTLLYPCYFGSALQNEGVEALLEGLESYTKMPEYQKEFAGKVYKITRDDAGQRLTHMKLTGGELKLRDEIEGIGKVNEIRVYSGEKYTLQQEVKAGDICAVPGFTDTYAGQGVGKEADFCANQLAPVCNYQILLPEGTEEAIAWRQLKQLEEEDPNLHLSWQAQTREIFIQPMGEVQLEVIKRMVSERYGMDIAFGSATILYRETIEDTVIGMGHFEPLRHYAEVHLKMEPLPRGSGLQFVTECSEDELDLNWQRLILTHLGEKEFTGVLTGSPITDIKFTLIAGRAHLKHTEGGDFRQATYRAVRQGLRQAKSRLLEPMYQFRMEVPMEQIGRVMSDVGKMHGTFRQQPDDGEMSAIEGICPVASMAGYGTEFAAFTKGRGRMTLSFCGYEPCHNESEVVKNCKYDPDADVENTADSVFCAHGSGFVVPWNEVAKHVHVDTSIKKRQPVKTTTATPKEPSKKNSKMSEEKELQAIFERTFGPVKTRVETPAKKVIKAEPGKTKTKEYKPVYEEEYLLVDGYNIIFAWDELKALAAENLEGARTKLMEIMCNYQGFCGCHLILVFDAYKVKGNPGSVEQFHNISVVYTKEAETADMYIEKTTKEIARKKRVRVATSDGMEQIIILGHGAIRISARAFQEEVKRVNDRIAEEVERRTEKL
ncbi:MAG: TetM/TetW/TetO/TetS family tetracycline resistance ribosomal protection protein [Roseburia sp.]|nr:TetM/TetW/TetO/TetS family tetracycline resistance ribosomal protection protein [Roseburia sp.]